jgi:hypothetical protein
MPPNFAFTRDEEINAVRMHLKKKRSQKSVGSPLRSSSITQRTILDFDLDSSFEDTVAKDDELEEMFKRKQSLTLDERIARKKKSGGYSKSLVVTKTRDQNSQNTKKKLVPSISNDQDELTYDNECIVPDCQSVDSIPLSYTADEASSILKAYDEKLASFERSRSQGSKDSDGLTKTIVEQAADQTARSVDEPDSYEKQTQVKITQTSIAKTSTRRSSISSQRPGIFHVPHSPSLSEKDKTKVTADSAFYSFEGGPMKKLSQSRRRSVSAPRPGIVHVPHSPTSTKEGKTKEKDSADFALDLFEGRLMKKLSQSSSIQLPSATTSRNNNTVSAMLWQCKRCAYLNDPSSSCKMCLVPRDEKTTGRQALHSEVKSLMNSQKLKGNRRDMDKTSDATSRPKLTTASKSERVLSSIPSKRKNARKALSTMRVSQSVNAASSATSWDDLGSVIDQTISMSLLETK